VAVAALARKVMAALVVAMMCPQQRAVTDQREVEADSMAVEVQQPLHLVLAVQLRAPRFPAPLMVEQVPHD
jgi:hypothetical protein